MHTTLVLFISLAASVSVLCFIIASYTHRRGYATGVSEADKIRRVDELDEGGCYRVIGLSEARDGWQIAVLLTNPATMETMRVSVSQGLLTEGQMVEVFVNGRKGVWPRE